MSLQSTSCTIAKLEYFYRVNKEGYRLCPYVHLVEPKAITIPPTKVSGIKLEFMDSLLSGSIAAITEQARKVLEWLERQTT